MNVLRRVLETEPVALVGVIVSLCYLAGVTLSDAHVEAITQIAGTLLPLVAAAVTRQYVTPVPKAIDQEQQAIADVLAAKARGDLDPYLEDT